MQPTIKTSSSGGKGFDALKASLKKIASSEVYVGIPEDHTTRQANAPITNAGLLYIHTNGSALQHIPARPVIEPAIQATDNAQPISLELRNAARSALDKQTRESKGHLTKAGMLARNAAIRWFTDPRNGWAPNAPSTVAEKGSDRPLINTAQMRRAITYLVKD